MWNGSLRTGKTRVQHRVEQVCREGGRLKYGMDSKTRTQVGSRDQTGEPSLKKGEGRGLEERHGLERRDEAWEKI